MCVCCVCVYVCVCVRACVHVCVFFAQLFLRCVHCLSEGKQTQALPLQSTSLPL